MITNIGQSTFENQLDSMVRECVKGKLETIMKEEMESFLRMNTQNEKTKRMVFTHASWIQDMADWRIYTFHEIAKMSFKPSCFLRTNVEKSG
uniref:N-terminal region of transposase of IS654 n=1 Tax=Halalkalibacterium halodurans TaxID=86665 RepID=Q75TW0_ALKHA|nr:N-terminal region of transposase of IS654 [Halalkalibacterium halodurans]